MPFAPRIESWLPRGGIGYCGVLSSALSLWGAFRWPPNVALPMCLGAGAFSVWCAFGLRRDGDHGEVVDMVIGEEKPRLTEVLLGDARYSEWRISTAIGISGVVSVLVALAKSIF